MTRWISAACVLAICGLALAAADKADSPQAFVKEAAQGGMAEVKLGELALKQATNGDVKSFGQRMIDDHGKANKELAQLAEKKGMSMPTDLGDKHQKAYDHLSGLKGAEFDKAYMSHMVDDHKEDVEAFQKQAKDGQDEDVKAFATKTLPTLEEHLKMAQEIAGKVGAAQPAASR